MKKTHILTAVGATALMLAGGVATTASAQPWRYSDHDRHSYSNSRLTTSYVDSLEWRINNSPISNGERRELLSVLRDIQPLAWRAQTGQASRWEIRRLENGVARIESATRYASNDRRYPRYGYNDRRW